MSVKIPDNRFQGPRDLNLHPCVTSSRWLNLVPEAVTITSICQDSNNTSLVIIYFTLVGAFYFTPTCKILAVDGDVSYGTNNITAPLAVGHYLNPTLPIDTNCTVYHGQLVFDFGHVIPNFTSATHIELSLEMAGSIPQSYGVSYPSQIVTHQYNWDKGVLPIPIGISYNNGDLNIIFGYNGNVDCNCQLQCYTPSGVNFNLSFCPDEQQSITLYQGDTNGDPYSVILQLVDGLGNTSNLEFQSMFTARPVALVVNKQTKPKRVEIGLFRQSINGAMFDNEAQYQIIKYQGSSTNTRIWKDWSSINWNTFIDYDIIPNERYGYAVRFKGKFNDISYLSDWAEIQA